MIALVLPLLAANLNCPPGYAATGPHPPRDCVWVSADTGDQSCGLDAHRHVLKLDENGNYMVNHEKDEPDIVFDGLCHDNTTEKVRKVLPVPKG